MAYGDLANWPELTSFQPASHASKAPAGVRWHGLPTPRPAHTSTGLPMPRKRQRGCGGMVFPRPDRHTPPRGCPCLESGLVRMVTRQGASQVNARFRHTDLRISEPTFVPRIGIT